MQSTAACRPSAAIARAGAGGPPAGPRRPVPLAPLARRTSVAARHHPAGRPVTVRRAMAEDEDPYEVCVWERE